MKYSSPSDYTAIAPSYSTGAGFYTDKGKISSLLQLPAFSSSTSPTQAEVGELIKRAEDYVDEITGTSFRPILYTDEVHNFTFTGVMHNFPRYYNDYVGFVQLDNSNIRKIIRLEAWQGNSWTDLASATATVTVSDYTNVTSVVLTLPNSGTSFTLTAGTTNARFNKLYGNKTTAQELAYLINEVFPATTSDITGATAPKSLSNISSYFYATVDSEDQTKVVISSLLAGEDGTECTIAVNGSGLSKSDFTDKEDMARLGDFWTIGPEGRIFFRANFPYNSLNSLRLTYLAGKTRVPSVITDATTKLAACDILRHDDSTVLIAESGAQIDIKSKYDLLRQEALDILDTQKESVYLIE
jgi:hypothetical protein